VLVVRSGDGHLDLMIGVRGGCGNGGVGVLVVSSGGDLIP
jgi:hypothetical protein